MVSLYDIIGVLKDATVEEIKKAYRSKAKALHPDKNLDDPEANSKFQELSGAYEVLKNKDKRQRYDETGKVNNEPTPKEEAMQLVAQLWLQFAEQNGFEPQSYWTKVREKVQMSYTVCCNEESKLARHAEKLDYLIANTKANEQLLMMLETKKLEFEGVVTHAKKAQIIMKEAFTIIDECEYTGTVPQPRSEHSRGGQMPWGAMTDPYIA